MANETKIEIRNDVDILIARLKGRAVAMTLQFSENELTGIADVISEMARNILKFGKPGSITLQVVRQNGRRGLLLTATDEGPPFSERNPTRDELTRAKQFMDLLQTRFEVGKGPVVTMTKYTVS